MEKKVSSTGMYETTSGKLDNQTKAALFEYLTESDDFHKLVCDITGVERKQEKVSQEFEKLKEDYSHMCESYEHEKQQRNDLIRKWREETAQRLDAERERDSAQRHHKFIVDEIFSMLKEVECSSVRGIVDELKEARLNGKVLAENNESIRRECERLKLSYDNVCKEKKSKSEEYEELQKQYADALLTNTKLKMKKEKAEKAKSETEKMYNTDFEYLNRYNQNQANTITKQMNELIEVRAELAEQRSKFIEEIELLKKDYQHQSDLAQKYGEKCEKLQAKLDKASKRYGELIKTISDRAIKSI